MVTEHLEALPESKAKVKRQPSLADLIELLTGSVTNPEQESQDSTKTCQV